MFSEKMADPSPICSRQGCSRPCKLKINHTYAKECQKCLNRYRKAYVKKRERKLPYHEALDGINENNNLEQSARHRYILQESEREEKEEAFLMEHKIMKQNIFTRFYDLFFRDKKRERFLNAYNTEKALKIEWFDKQRPRTTEIVKKCPRQSVIEDMDSVSEINNDIKEFEVDDLFNMRSTQCMSESSLALLILGRSNTGKSNAAKEIVRKLHNKRSSDIFSS